VHNNFVNIELAASPENVGLARIIVAGFISPLDPSVNEISDIKTAVSEAVTNAIIHGYDEHGGKNGTVQMRLVCNGRKITIEICDKGIGIENIDAVREPLFTTKPEMERSGLGFTVMENFMDTIEVVSTPGEGTTITLTKTLAETTA